MSGLKSQLKRYMLSDGITGANLQNRMIQNVPKTQVSLKMSQVIGFMLRGSVHLVGVDLLRSIFVLYA